MDVHDEFSGDFSARLYRVVAPDGCSRSFAAPASSSRLTFDDGPYPIFTPLLLDELHKVGRPGDVLLDRSRCRAVARDHAAHRSRRKRNRRSHVFASESRSRNARAGAGRSASRARRAVVDRPRSVGAFSDASAARTLHDDDACARCKASAITSYCGPTTRVIGERLRRGTSQATCSSHASAPDIVLLHSGKLATIEALPMVIERFRRAGYRFVTVGEMLRLDVAAGDQPSQAGRQCKCAVTMPDDHRHRIEPAGLPAPSGYPLADHPRALHRGGLGRRTDLASDPSQDGDRSGAGSRKSGPRTKTRGRFPSWTPFRRKDAA